MTAVIPAAGAMARIQEIQARFEVPQTRTATDAPSVATTAVGDEFSTWLANASTLNGGTRLAAGSHGAHGADLGDTIVRQGTTYLGVPYVWGGTDPNVGLDCSGFVQRVHRDLGIELPRVSRDQARGGQPVGSLAEARPGDVLAFGQPVNHVAIYAGDGMMIHAPRRGDVVTLEPIDRPITAIRRYTGGSPAASVDLSGRTALAPALSAVAPTGSSSAREAAFADLFAAAGARHGIDPRILSAVARVESGYDPTAVSSAGAQGLMQFMPATAAGMGIDPLDPAQAVDGAARYLTDALRDFGSLDLALAAYNAGPGAVRRHGGIPPYTETQNYVTRVMSILNGTS